MPRCSPLSWTLRQVAKVRHPAAASLVPPVSMAMAIEFVDIEPDAEALVGSIDPELPLAKPAPKKRGRK